jgi:hypothetical protein
MQSAGVATPLPFIYVARTPRMLLATFEPYTKYSGGSLSLLPLSLLLFFRLWEGLISPYILRRDLCCYPELV